MSKVNKVKVHLEDLMWERRIKSIHQLSRETNISRPSLTRLYKNEANYRPDMEVLVKLCDFFGCALTDLIEYDPREREAIGGD